MKRTNYNFIKIILTSLLMVIGAVLISNLYFTHIDKIKKAEYERGIANQYNEERYLDSIENKLEVANLPSGKELNRYELLKQLALLESLGGEKRKILDTNNKYSLGLYHFQAGTVKDLYKRYYKKDITIQEAVRIAQDDKLATELAYDVIFKWNGKHHWVLSFCRLNNRGLVQYSCPLKKGKYNLS
jgi:hypothetical protein